jgi:transcriptional regulator with XRE-family HTH domain
MKFNNDRIRQLREQHGLSKRKFAEAIGVKRESVIQWEQGLCAPRQDIIGRMCSAFDTEPNYFFDLEIACKQTKEAS